MFRLNDGKPSVYLTFDDGPIPESTPWLLETLEAYGAKATFFMVADNARRYPDLFCAVVEAGHAIGNHTFHHRPPFRQTVEEVLASVKANVRPGCIINLHDSLKSIAKLKRCLPEILDYLVSQGYRCRPLTLNSLTP